MSQSIDVEEPWLANFSRRSPLERADADDRAHVTLLGEPRDVTVARGFVRRVVAAANPSADWEDVVLVLSELVTDSIVAGRGPISVDISVYSDWVLLWVTDTGRPTLERRRCLEPEDQARRSQVINQLCTDWWVQRTPTASTTVAIVELSTEGAAEPQLRGVERVG